MAKKAAVPKAITMADVAQYVDPPLYYASFMYSANVSNPQAGLLKEFNGLWLKVQTIVITNKSAKQDAILFLSDNGSPSGGDNSTSFGLTPSASISTNTYFLSTIYTFPTPIIFKNNLYYSHNVPIDIDNVIYINISGILTNKI